MDTKAHLIDVRQRHLELLKQPKSDITKQMFAERNLLIEMVDAYIDYVRELEAEQEDEEESRQDEEDAARMAAIEARLAAITPGEWQATWNDDILDDVRVCNVEDGNCIGCLALMGEYDEATGEWAGGTVGEWRSNADMVAHAPDDMRWLLTKLREGG